MTATGGSHVRLPRPVGRRGFSLVELLTVMVFVGILAGIAAPRLHRAVQRATAAKVVSDFHTIRMAVELHSLARDGYPGSGEWGVVPAGLQDYLPDGFHFEYGRVEYRYRRFAEPGPPGDGGGGGSAPPQPAVGVEVRTSDAGVLESLQELARGWSVLQGAQLLLLIIH